jgi:FAD:protein FMN transferase
MDTIVSATVLDEAPESEVRSALDVALGWFGEVERRCSRFDAASEVWQLAEHAGESQQVSTLLFEAVRFALHVAELTGGIFDPTVGAAQARRGFDRNYVTGQRVATPAEWGRATFHDVRLDAQAQTIELARPLLLDLGAVAKGLAIDLAAMALSAFASYSIDAGGDLYARGLSQGGQPWRIGIEHPRQEGLLATVQLDAGAVCTSGDYIRQASEAGEHHLLDPRSGHSPREAVSCTVVAPSAMLADALSTAALILGPRQGLSLLESQQVDGLIVSTDLSISQTPHFHRWLV